MAAIEALQTAVGTLRRNPVLFLAGLILGLILLPQTVVQFLQVPLLPFALQVVTFFVTPFVVAGLLGMADEGLSGRTGLGTLTGVGRERYLPLLLGNVVQFAIVAVFGIAFTIGAFAAILSLGISTGGQFAPEAMSAGTLLVIGGAFLLLMLAFLVVYFFVQFFSVAIVVAEEGPISGFTASYGFVRRNLLSTLGYSVITFIVALVTSTPITGFVLLRTLQNAGTQTPEQAPAATAGLFSPAEVAAIAVFSLALSTVLQTFQQTYAVAFWRRHADDAESDVDEDEFTEPDYTV